MFVIRNAKAGKDIHLPITPEIAFAISLAVNAEVNPHHEVKETDLVFPGCRQISQRAALPIRGQAFHGCGRPEDSRSDSPFPAGSRAQRYFSRLRCSFDFAEWPGDARGAGADFEAHSQTSLPHVSDAPREDYRRFDPIEAGEGAGER
jgi:hypothetical protein